MFVDVAKIYTKAGDGGRGNAAMRREKYVPEGGPWGGDGGRGGDVIFRVDPGLNTLLDFKYQRHFKAERGEHGLGKGQYGKGGKDLVVKVPPGTLVKDAETGEVLFDLTEPGQPVVVCKGGRGGRGNIHFATSVQKAPKIYEEGEPGEERWVVLELKLIADVGLVGYPNAGKSTFLAATTAAKPKIANYPFTTLIPNLGVVEVGDGRGFVLADIPGLIEGAHTGIGLGHEFLRHVERCKVLIHMVDGSGGDEGRDPVTDFDAINQELELHNPKLAARPQLVAFNKIDLPAAADHLVRFKQVVEDERGYQVFPISGATRDGLEPLLQAAMQAIERFQPEEVPVVEETERVYRAEDPRAFEIQRDHRGIWNVYGRDIERLVAMTPWQNEEAVVRFQRIFRRSGIENTLRKAGARGGDTVEIRGVQFEMEEGIEE